MAALIRSVALLTGPASSATFACLLFASAYEISPGPSASNSNNNSNYRSDRSSLTKRPPVLEEKC